MLNEKFWLAIAFLSFIILSIKYVWPKLSQALDNKSKQIAEEILAAKELKEKAQKLLASAEKYLIESEQLSKKLLQDAESETAKFIETAKKNAEAEIAKISSAAVARVKVEEEIAIREVKVHIISSAIKNLSDNVKNMDKKQQEHLIKQSTEDFSKLIH